MWQGVLPLRVVCSEVFPWSIKSAPPAIPFDAPVAGMGAGAAPPAGGVAPAGGVQQSISPQVLTKAWRPPLQCRQWSFHCLGDTNACGIRYAVTSTAVKPSVFAASVMLSILLFHFNMQHNWKLILLETSLMRPAEFQNDPTNVR